MVDHSNISPLDILETPLQVSEGARILLLAPGPHAAAIESVLHGKEGAISWTLLDSTPQRLKLLNIPLTNLNTRPAQFVLARATRLPFVSHSFDAIISFEALYAIRPPWTVLAEYHRVLVPDGKLALIEPQSHGFFSALRDKISGPGKRIFSVDEIRYRMARSDYALESLQEDVRADGVAHPLYCVVAIKKENPVEPVPQFQTAREMIARRKNKFPAGEELP